MEPMQNVAGNMHGREDAIKAWRCVDPPMGCGRELVKAEVLRYPTLSLKEYFQSGWCKACQDKVFADPDEDPNRCTCDDPPCCEADVGVGIITCGDSHATPCPQHEVDEAFEFRIYEHDIYDPEKHNGALRVA